jgi:uncharacterized ion transporter superfamily protein YfcC
MPIFQPNVDPKKKARAILILSFLGVSLLAMVIGSATDNHIVSLCGLVVLVAFLIAVRRYREHRMEVDPAFKKKMEDWQNSPQTKAMYERHCRKMRIVLITLATFLILVFGVTYLTPYSSGVSKQTFAMVLFIVSVAAGLAGEALYQRFRRREFT